MQREQRPLVVNGPPYPDVIDPYVLEVLGVRSLLVVPMLNEGRLLGGITASFLRRAVPFRPADVEFVEGLASHAVAALRRARLHDALRASEARYRSLVEDVHEVIFVLDRSGTFTFVGGRVQRILGYRPEELVGRHFLSVVAPHHHQAALQRYLEEVQAPHSHTDEPEVHYDVIRKDGSVVSLEIGFSIRVDEADNLVEIYGVARDVTERMRLLHKAELERRRTRAALRKERRERARAEALLEVVTAASSTLSLTRVLVQICDAVARLSVADRCSIFLYDPEAKNYRPLMSRGIEDPDLWDRFQHAPGADMQEAKSFRVALETRRPYLEPHVPGSDAVSPFWAETFRLKSLAVYPMVVRNHVVGMMTVDAFTRFVKFPREEVKTLMAIARQAAVIIDNARLFERVQQQAQTDFLTGLPNHRHMQDLFERTLRASEQAGTPFCVVMADIDNFKLFNDVHGHPAGDEVLRQVSAVIRQCLRPGDVVGCYGGDEFLFLLPGADRDQGDRIMARLARQVAKTPITLPGRDGQILVRISWGAAAYPADSTQRRSLISLADAALMARKARLRERERGQGRRGWPRNLTELYPDRLRLAEDLLEIIDGKDGYTCTHSRHHASLCLVLADELGLPDRERYALWLGGLLHDVGKIGVPDDLLRKAGPLTPEEWDVVRRHTVMGENIVRGLFGLEEVAAAVGSHHERYDGTGYPRGLRGEQIPRLARMLAVVDAYSAMIHDRPYRRALHRDEAIAELRRHAGTQFDPLMVRAFLRALGYPAEDAA
ncbi:MAG TPA: diguanylate cyclase [Dehalococcoidia bacterium]